MSCPYSDDDLEMFDGVSNPMGSACYECADFDCEHNANINDPDGQITDDDCLGCGQCPDCIRLCIENDPNNEKSSPKGQQEKGEGPLPRMGNGA